VDITFCHVRWTATGASSRDRQPPKVVDDYVEMKLNVPVHAIISIRPLLVFSTLIRLVLVLYSEWHDRHSLVKYTDVDYLVFTDATSYTLTPGPLNHAQGPLGKWVNIGE
jgi:hypothetical protein